ncbi:MAG: VCBS repeat-containing protein, partial [Planctomycetes bacterium]|nr:VCBS repeat-containing protein [Planctomycetota bacterium]
MRAFSNPLLGMISAAMLLAPLAGCFEPDDAPDEVETAEEVSPVVEVPPPVERFSAEKHRLDPRNDGWESEVFAEQALAQLKLLGKLLADPATVRPENLASVAVEDVLCSELRPDNLSTVFDDQPLTVRTSSAAGQAGLPAKGLAGFAAALRRLTRDEQDASPLEVHVKITRVVLKVDHAETTVVYEASGRQRGIVFQQNATWLCQWQRQPAAPPRLSAITLQHFAEVDRATSPESRDWFVDCTQSVLGREAGFREHLAYGMQHWLGRIERIHMMLYFQRHGLAVADVNGDGLDDLYVCQPGGLPNRLFLQRPDGTAAEASAQARVDWLDHTASALLVDLDNDGDQDLVLATVEGVQVLANDGQAKFDLVLTLPTADSDVHSLSAADYDADGDLDLYVTFDNASVRARPDETRQPFSYHDAN